MKFRYFLMLALFACLNTEVLSQPTFTADDVVEPYTGYFGYGANMGAYPPWRDENLANIAAGNDSLGLDGIGITTFRPELPELFVEFWGYDIRKEAFQHYDDLGMKDHVLFVGQPSPEHRDSTFYCDEHMSKLFKNMYAPIWDNGENGTPINDTNYYARYVYLLALNYGEHIKFWEVWNEPDLDVGGNAPLPPGAPNNWWDNDPPPCEVHVFAPIQHYNRLLRMTYEIVKIYDPNSYIAVGGLGNPSFLDAVLRNTDNPVDGSVTPEYPHKGGAYFDCMSFHSYPHLDGSMRGWDDEKMDFIFFRHSDAALNGLMERRDWMDDVLDSHGYNGVDKPEKVWILTESNIPRKAFQRGFIGTPIGQRNFLMKALVKVQQYDVHQFHVYSLADVEPVDSANYEFEVMGLFKNLTGTMPHAHELTEAGIAYGSTAQILQDYRFNDSLTQLLDLPPNDSIRGCAFKNDNDEVIFTLWATTAFDSTEYASQIFSLSENMNIENLERFSWHYMVTNSSDIISPVDIPLTGSPIFLKANFKSTSTTQSFSERKMRVTVFPNPSKGQFKTSLYLNDADRLSVELLDVNGNLVRQVMTNQYFPQGEAIFETERNGLANGVYFMKIGGSKQGATVTKVILF